ncbi:phosphoribosyltransferase family protein [Roseovarius sp.]|uniref:phosphoribosyltransferase n=1 Tax=Roseovarius sp. TaxID=1486281 RepID=UPI0026222BEB|nr:phosphoribosyltransferase family protein [Roseovarius sp.]
MAGFQDREDAGKALLAALPEVDPANTVVIALPRGGVPVAQEICKALKLPLDLVFVRKIGAPMQPELAVGAVVDGARPEVVVNHEIARNLGLSDAQVSEMAQTLLPEIARRRATYLEGRAPIDLAGKTVIVVDDGIATGATVKASLIAVRNRGAAHIILAVPVAPPDTLHELETLTDEIVCLYAPRYFGAVGAHYRYFPQVSDAEVIAALQDARRAL